MDLGMSKLANKITRSPGAGNMATDNDPHGLIVIRPAVANQIEYQECVLFDQKRRPYHHVAVHGFGSIHAMNLTLKEYTVQRKYLAVEILQQLNGEEDGHTYLCKLFENLVVSRYQKGGENVEIQTKGGGAVTLGTLKPGIVEFTSIGNLKEVLKGKGKGKVNDYVLNKLIIPSFKNCPAIDGLVILRNDDGLYEVFFLQTTVDLTHDIKMAPKAFVDIVDALPEDVQQLGNGCRVFFIFLVPNERVKGSVIKYQPMKLTERPSKSTY